MDTVKLAYFGSFCSEIAFADHLKKKQHGKDCETGFADYKVA